MEKATQNGQTVSANIKTKYVGVTADGKWVSSKGNEPEDALREPGNYVEKIYTSWWQLCSGTNRQMLYSKKS